MNILLIIHEYYNRHIKYATFLQELGHKVDLLRLKGKQIPGQVTSKQYSSKYDIVWAYAADYIWYKVLTDDFIACVKHSRSIFVNGFSTLSELIPFKDWANNYKVFDICFLTSKLVTDMARQYGLTNVYFMPFGFDMDEYYPIKGKKKYNVSFAGNALGRRLRGDNPRVDALNALKDFGVRAFGISFKGKVDKSIKVSPYRTHKEQNKIYNQSKINLNEPSINSPLPEFLNGYHTKCRFYEIPGSGNFMISGYADEFNEQFQEGVHCAYYHSIDDLCAKVEYYLTHEQEREDIARAGYEHALKYHQTRFRFRDMMNIIQEKFF